MTRSYFGVDKDKATLVVACVQSQTVRWVRRFNFQDFLLLDWYEDGGVIVGETSHFTIKDICGAQIYNRQQLTQLRDAVTARGGEIRTVAESVTPRKLAFNQDAIRAYGIALPDRIADTFDGKDDAVAIAIALDAEQRGYDTLCRLQIRQPSELEQWALKERQRLNLAWLVLGEGDTKWSLDAVATLSSEKPENQQLIAELTYSFGQLCRWVEDGAWEGRLQHPELFYEFFGLLTKGGKVSTSRKTRKGLVSYLAPIWYSLLGTDGRRRRDGLGHVVGVNRAMRYLLVMKENHRRGGRHRAHLYYHRLPAIVNQRVGKSSTRRDKGGKPVSKLWSEFTEQDKLVFAQTKRDLRKVVKDVMFAILDTPSYWLL